MSETATPAQAEWVHASTLRSIANSIEPAFPDAADLLRGIAREGAAVKREAVKHEARATILLGDVGTLTAENAALKATR